jgi:hypothetical protein
MLQNFNVPGQTGKPCAVTAILDGEVIAKGECAVNAFTHMAYKSCYDAIPAEYEPRINKIILINQWGDVIKLETWIKVNGY